jgi:DMSO/TMAO reductase YedYZ molybdopterin-dependent catalytic subunit
LATRRATFRLLGVSLATTVSWLLLERAAESLAAPGARRLTGSKHAVSVSGNDYPVTIWLLDAVPRLDDSWRLGLVGELRRTGSLSYADLLALPRTRIATVLDCTGGWWSEQVWSGVEVGELLRAHEPLPGALSATVSSVTGHQWTFPLDELRGALLATHVGGEPLAAGHGAPLRLVVPGRRGFQWIKWVGRIEVA